MERRTHFLKPEKQRGRLEREEKSGDERGRFVIS